MDKFKPSAHEKRELVYKYVKSRKKEVLSKAKVFLTVKGNNEAIDRCRVDSAVEANGINLEVRAGKFGNDELYVYISNPRYVKGKECVIFFDQINDSREVIKLLFTLELLEECHARNIVCVLPKDVNGWIIEVLKQFANLELVTKADLSKHAFSLMQVKKEIWKDYKIPPKPAKESFDGVLFMPNTEIFKQAGIVNAQSIGLDESGNVILPQGLEKNGHYLLVCATDSANWLVRLFKVLFTLKKSGISPVLFFTYFSYMRQHKAYRVRKHGTFALSANSARAVLMGLSVFSRQIRTLNIHFSKEIGTVKVKELFPGLAKSIEIYNLNIFTDLAGYFKDKKRLVNPVVIGADKGAAIFSEDAAKNNAIEYGGHMDKKRDPSKPVRFQVTMIMPQIDVHNKDVILLDDIISSGETIINAALLLLSRGARRIFIGSVYGEFTEGVNIFKDRDMLRSAMKQLKLSGQLTEEQVKDLEKRGALIEEVVSTDIIPNPFAKIKVGAMFNRYKFNLINLRKFIAYLLDNFPAGVDVKLWQKKLAMAEDLYAALGLKSDAALGGFNRITEEISYYGRIRGPNGDISNEKIKGIFDKFFPAKYSQAEVRDLVQTIKTHEQTHKVNPQETDENKVFLIQAKKENQRIHALLMQVWQHIKEFVNAQLIITGPVPAFAGLPNGFIGLQETKTSNVLFMRVNNNNRRVPAVNPVEPIRKTKIEIKADPLPGQIKREKHQEDEVIISADTLAAKQCGFVSYNKHGESVYVGNPGGLSQRQRVEIAEREIFTVVIEDWDKKEQDAAKEVDRLFFKWGISYYPDNSVDSYPVLYNVADNCQVVLHMFDKFLSWSNGEYLTVFLRGGFYGYCIKDIFGLLITFAVLKRNIPVHIVLVEETLKPYINMLQERKQCLDFLDKFPVNSVVFINGEPEKCNHQHAGYKFSVATSIYSTLEDFAQAGRKAIEEFVPGCLEKDGYRSIRVALAGQLTQAQNTFIENLNDLELGRIISEAIDTTNPLGAEAVINTIKHFVPKGAPATLLRYMAAHRIYKDNPKKSKEMAGQRGGNDSLRTIQRELSVLQAAGLVEGNGRSGYFLLEWLKHIDIEVMIQENPVLDSPGAGKDDAYWIKERILNSKLSDNSWMKLLYRRYGEYDGIRKVLIKFLERNHAFKIQAFSEIDRLSNEEVLEKADRYVNNWLLEQQDQFVSGGNDYYHSIESLSLREILLYPTTGILDLSQLLFTDPVINFPYGFPAFIIEKIGQECISSRLASLYLIIKAVSILSNDPSLMSMQEQDVDNLFNYLKDRADHFGFERVPENILSLADIFITFDLARQQSSLKNLFMLMSRLQKEDAGWEKVLFTPNSEDNLPEVSDATKAYFRFETSKNRYPATIPASDAPDRAATQEEMGVVVTAFGGKDALIAQGVTLDDTNTIISPTLSSPAEVNNGILYINPNTLRGPPEQLKVIFQGHELARLQGKVVINYSNLLCVKDIPKDQLDGQTVFLSVDLNVGKTSKKLKSEKLTRVKAVVQDIKYLIKNKARKIILVSHNGDCADYYKGLNPDEITDGMVDPDYSLQPVAEILTAILKENSFEEEVIFLPGCVGKNIKDAIKEAERGVFLLENPRFFAAETAKDKAQVEVFARELQDAIQADIYVQAAAGALHRGSQASRGPVTSFIKGPKVVGLLVEKELRGLYNLATDPAKPVIAIMQGAKLEGKLEVIKSLITNQITDKVAVLGKMAIPFIKNEPIAEEIRGLAQKYNVELILPSRIIAARLPEDTTVELFIDSLKKDPKKTVEAGSFSVNSVPDGWLILDVDPDDAADLMLSALKGVNTIIINGTAGLNENEQFARGTNKVMDVVARYKREYQQAVLIGLGGDGVSAAKTMLGEEEAERLFELLSTMGGSALDYLTGKELSALNYIQTAAKTLICAEQENGDNNPADRSANDYHFKTVENAITRFGGIHEILKNEVKDIYRFPVILMGIDTAAQSLDLTPSEVANLLPARSVRFALAPSGWKIGACIGIVHTDGKEEPVIIFPQDVNRRIIAHEIRAALIPELTHQENMLIENDSPYYLRRSWELQRRIKRAVRNDFGRILDWQNGPEVHGNFFASMPAAGWVPQGKEVYLDTFHAISAQSQFDAPVKFDAAKPVEWAFKYMGEDLKAIMEYLKVLGKILGLPGRQFDALRFPLAYHRDGQMYWAQGLTERSVRKAIEALSYRNKLHFSADTIISHIRLHESMPTEEGAINSQAQEFGKNYLFIGCLKELINFDNLKVGNRRRGYVDRWYLERMLKRGRSNPDELKEEFFDHLRAYPELKKYLSRESAAALDDASKFLNTPLGALTKELLDKKEIIIKGEGVEDFIFKLSKIKDEGIDCFEIEVYTDNDGSRLRVGFIDFRLGIISAGIKYGFKASGNSGHDRAIEVSAVYGDRGIGKALISLALALAKIKGKKKFMAYSCSNAEAFYTAVGFRRKGQDSDFEFDLSEQIIPAVKIKLGNLVSLEKRLSEMDFKLAIFGLDNSLARTNQNVSEEMLSRIRTLLRLGVKVAVVDGISLAELRKRIGAEEEEDFSDNLLLADFASSKTSLKQLVIRNAAISDDMRKKIIRAVSKAASELDRKEEENFLIEHSDHCVTLRLIEHGFCFNHRAAAELTGEVRYQLKLSGLSDVDAFQTTSGIYITPNSKAELLSAIISGMGVKKHETFIFADQIFTVGENPSLLEAIPEVAFANFGEYGLYSGSENVFDIYGGVERIGLILDQLIEYKKQANVSSCGYTEEELSDAGDMAIKLLAGEKIEVISEGNTKFIFELSEVSRKISEHFEIICFENGVKEAGYINFRIGVTESWIKYRVDANGNAKDIYAIKTQPEYEDMGIGKALMLLAMAIAKIKGSVKFRVYNSAPDALGFYQALGFKSTGSGNDFELSLTGIHLQPFRLKMSKLDHLKEKFAEKKLKALVFGLNDVLTGAGKHISWDMGSRIDYFLRQGIKVIIASGFDLGEMLDNVGVNRRGSLPDNLILIGSMGQEISPAAFNLQAELISEETREKINRIIDMYAYRIDPKSYDDFKIINKPFYVALRFCKQQDKYIEPGWSRGLRFMELFRSALLEEGVSGINVVRSTAGIYFTPNSKGKAVSDVLNKLGIAQEECIVFADQLLRDGDERSLLDSLPQASFINLGELNVRAKSVFDMHGGVEQAEAALDILINNIEGIRALEARSIDSVNKGDLCPARSEKEFFIDARMEEKVKKALVDIGRIREKDFSAKRLSKKVWSLLYYKGVSGNLVRRLAYNAVIEMSQAVAAGKKERGKVLGLAGQISGIYEIVIKRGTTLEMASLGSLEKSNALIYNFCGMVVKEFDAVSTNAVFEFKFHLSLHKLYQQVIGIYASKLSHLEVLNDYPEFSGIRNLVYFGEADSGYVIEAINTFIAQCISEHKDIPQILPPTEKGVSVKFTLPQIKEFLCCASTLALTRKEEGGMTSRPAIFEDSHILRRVFAESIIDKKIEQLKGEKFDIIIAVSNAPEEQLKRMKEILSEKLPVYSADVSLFADQIHSPNPQVFKFFKRYSQGLWILEGYLAKSGKFTGPPEEIRVAYFNKISKEIAFNITSEEAADILKNNGFEDVETEELWNFICRHEELHKENPSRRCYTVLEMQWIELESQVFAREILMQMRPFINKISSYFFRSLKSEFRGKYPYLCKEASFILARLISRAFKLSIGGNAPDRIEMVSGVIIKEGLIASGLHRWLVIYKDDKRALLIDPVFSRFNEEFIDTILLGYHEELSGKYSFVEWEDFKYQRESYLWVSVLGILGFDEEETSNTIREVRAGRIIDLELKGNIEKLEGIISGLARLAEKEDVKNTQNPACGKFMVVITREDIRAFEMARENLDSVVKRLPQTRTAALFGHSAVHCKDLVEKFDRVILAVPGQKGSDLILGLIPPEHRFKVEIRKVDGSGMMGLFRQRKAEVCKYSYPVDNCVALSKDLQSREPAGIESFFKGTVDLVVAEEFCSRLLYFMLYSLETEILFEDGFPPVVAAAEGLGDKLQIAFIKNLAYILDPEGLIYYAENSYSPFSEKLIRETGLKEVRGVLAHRKWLDSSDEVTAHLLKYKRSLISKGSDGSILWGRGNSLFTEETNGVLEFPFSKKSNIKLEKNPEQPEKRIAKFMKKTMVCELFPWKYSTMELTFQAAIKKLPVNMRGKLEGLWEDDPGIFEVYKNMAELGSVSGGNIKLDIRNFISVMLLALTIRHEVDHLLNPGDQEEDVGIRDALYLLDFGEDVLGRLRRTFPPYFNRDGFDTDGYGANLVNSVLKVKKFLRTRLESEEERLCLADKLFRVLRITPDLGIQECYEAVENTISKNEKFTQLMRLMTAGIEEISCDLGEDIKRRVRELEYPEKTAEDFAAMAESWKDSRGCSVIFEWKDALSMAKEQYRRGKIPVSVLAGIEQRLVNKVGLRILQEMDGEGESDDLDEIMRTRAPSCLGYSELFYVLGNALGLVVKGVEPLELRGSIEGHSFCMAYLSDTRAVLVDLAYREFISRPFEFEQKFRAAGKYWEFKGRDPFMKFYRKILILDGKGLVAILYGNRGLRLCYPSRYEEALHYINKAIEYAPDSPALHRKLGHVYHEMFLGEENVRSLVLVDKSLNALDKAIEMDSESALAHRNRAVVSVDAQKPVEAVAEFIWAALLHPQWAGGICRFLWHLLRLKECSFSDILRGIPYYFQQRLARRVKRKLNTKAQLPEPPKGTVSGSDGMVFRQWSKNPQLLAEGVFGKLAPLGYAISSFEIEEINSKLNLIRRKLLAEGFFREEDFDIVMELMDYAYKTATFRLGKQKKYHITIDRRCFENQDLLYLVIKHELTDIKLNALIPGIDPAIRELFTLLTVNVDGMMKLRNEHPRKAAELLKYLRKVANLRIGLFPRYETILNNPALNDSADFIKEICRLLTKETVYFSNMRLLAEKQHMSEVLLEKLPFRFNLLKLRLREINERLFESSRIIGDEKLEVLTSYHGKVPVAIKAFMPYAGDIQYKIDGDNVFLKVKFRDESGQVRFAHIYLGQNDNIDLTLGKGGKIFSQTYENWQKENPGIFRYKYDDMEKEKRVAWSNFKRLPLTQMIKRINQYNLDHGSRDIQDQLKDLFLQLFTALNLECTLSSKTWLSLERLIGRNKGPGAYYVIKHQFINDYLSKIFPRTLLGEINVTLEPIRDLSIWPVTENPDMKSALLSWLSNNKVRGAPIYYRESEKISISRLLYLLSASIPQQQSLFSGGPFLYSLPVPCGFQKQSESKFGRNKTLTSIEIENLNIQYPETFFEDYYQVLQQLLNSLEKLLGRAPPELSSWKLIISTDFTFTLGNVAACDIEKHIVYLHPYFFNISQEDLAKEGLTTEQLQLKILYHELVSHITKRLKDPLAMIDTEYFSRRLSGLCGSKAGLWEDIKHRVMGLEYSEKIAKDFVNMIKKWKYKGVRNALLNWEMKLLKAQKEWKDGLLPLAGLVEIESSVVKFISRKILEEIDSEDGYFELDEIIFNKKANCLGYSQAFYLLANSLGLMAEVVSVLNVRNNPVKHVFCLVLLSDYKVMAVDLASQMVDGPFEFSQRFKSCGNCFEAKDTADITAAYERIQLNARKGLIAAIYNNRAGDKRISGSNEEVLALYNKAIAYYPQYALAYRNRARIYAYCGRYEEADKDIDSAIELGIKDALQYYEWGIDSRLDEEASFYFSAAIKAGYRDAIIYYRRGLAYNNLEKYQEAVSDFIEAAKFNEAAELKPGLANIYYCLGVAYDGGLEFSKALDSFSRVIEINSDFSKAYHKRAKVYLKLNKPELARKDFEAAVKLDSWLREDVEDVYEERGWPFEVSAASQKGLEQRSGEDFALETFILKNLQKDNPAAICAENPATRDPGNYSSDCVKESHPLLPIIQFLAWVVSGIVGLFTRNQKPAKIFSEVFKYSYSIALKHLLETARPVFRLAYSYSYSVTAARMFRIFPPASRFIYPILALFIPVARGFRGGCIQWLVSAKIRNAVYQEYGYSSERIANIEGSVKVHEQARSELAGLWAQYRYYKSNCLLRYLSKHGGKGLVDKLTRELSPLDIKIFPGIKAPAYRVSRVNEILDVKAERIFLNEAAIKKNIDGRIYNIYHVSRRGTVALTSINDKNAWVAGNSGKEGRKLKRFFDYFLHIALPLGVLGGSVYVLTLPFVSGLSALASVAVISALSLAGVAGLFYFVENVRRLFEHKPAKFFFGAWNQIKKLNVEKRSVLIRAADVSYMQQEKKIRPSLGATVIKIFSLRGLALLVSGALVAFIVTGTINWWILAGAIAAVFVPYLIAIFYIFFCFDIDRYKFRNEFIREHLNGIKVKDGFVQELKQLSPGYDFSKPFKNNLWNNFTLRFPVSAGVIAFILGKLPVIFFGYLAGAAIVPFLGMEAANFSLSDLLQLLSGALKWEWADNLFQQLISVINNSGLMINVGEAVKLSMVVLGFGALSLFHRVRSFPKTVIHNFLHFLPNLLHIWIIAAIIGGGSFGSLFLYKAQVITKVNFPQAIHQFIGGKENVAVWNRANLLYQQVRVNPEAALQNIVPASDLELLLKEIEEKEKIKGLAPADLELKRFCIYKLGQGYGSVNSGEILKSALSDPDNDLRAIATISLITRYYSSDAIATLNNFKFTQGGPVQQAAILSLKKLYFHQEVKDFLLKILHDGGLPENQLVAMGALSEKVSSPEIRTSFVDVLKSTPDALVKQAAILSLAPQADYEIMKIIRPFLADLDLGVRQATIVSLGLRLNDFPENFILLKPQLTSSNVQIRATAVSALGPSLDKFPELKQPFLDIAKDASLPVEMRQNALFSVSVFDEPQVKNLLVDNLDSMDWQMRQVAAFGLGNFKGAEIPDLLKPLTKDSNWQVRQSAAASLGNFDQAQVIDYLKPLLDDDHWEVRLAAVDSFGNFDDPQVVDLLTPVVNDSVWQIRQSAVTSLGNFDTPEAIKAITPSLSDSISDVRCAGILPLAASLEKFPELKQPLMDRYQDSFEDEWVRSIAMTSLQNAGYTKELYLDNIQPLEKSVVIFVPGMDDDLGSDLSSSRDPGWSTKLQLRLDFNKVESVGAAKIFEFNWPGNITNYSQAESSLVDYLQQSYVYAKQWGADSITLPLHSAGNSLSYKAIDLLTEWLERDKIRMKINIVGMGSPASRTAERFYEITTSTSGQFKNFWSIFDPVSWFTAFSPSSQMIWGNHGSYFSDLDVRQAALSMATGINIPISYSRFSVGSFTDPYFSGTFNIKQTTIYFSPQLKTTKINIVTNYGTMSQASLVLDYNSSLNFQSPDFSTWNGSYCQPLPRTYTFPSSNFSSYQQIIPPSVTVPSFRYTPPVINYNPPTINYTPPVVNVPQSNSSGFSNWP
ncbi:MAG: phosphoglycerate kinase [Candidatus Omnitrophica bacterium]|nr:phosphoglycerate kinase [Candidatus Omnitrophota bacterium]